jgi:signal transduction histidine kinase
MATPNAPTLEQMVALYDPVAVGVVIHDAAGAILYANPAAVDLLGIPGVLLRGRTPVGPLWRASQEDGSPLPDQELPPLVALRTGSAARATVSVGIAPSRWLRIDAVPVLGSDGHPVRVVSTLQDVSAQKDAERQAMALARHENLRAIGEMAGGVAHDISKWLTLIAGHAELALTWLNTSKADMAPIADTLDTIVRAAWDGTAMLQRVARFAQADATERSERVELGALLRDVVQLTSPKWRDGARMQGRTIRLHLEAPADSWVEGSPGRLREVFANVIFNAVDALPQGGTILVAVSRQGGMIEVSVTDNGVGMTPEVSARVFEPFFTTKGEQGTGLGLALVAGIVEQHHGRVTAESAPGLGTTIRISFPATDS